MIGKNMTGRSFGGCVRYVLGRKEATLLEAVGVRTRSAAVMTRDFNIQRMMNPKLGKAVGHLVLSWSKEDLPNLSPEIMADRAREYMYLMDISNTQYATVQHTDRLNPHLHIIYNRVDNEGKTISDQYNYKRNEIACKAITEKYGYHFAAGKEQVNRDRLKGSEKLRYELFDTISYALKYAKSWKELDVALQCIGIRIQYKYRIGTEQVQGVSFNKGDLSLKGSAIDRSLSYANIDKQLQANFQQEQARIEGTLVSVPSSVYPEESPHSEPAAGRQTNSTFASWLNDTSWGGVLSHDVDDEAVFKKRRKGRSR